MGAKISTSIFIPSSGSTTRVEPVGYAIASGFQDIISRNNYVKTAFGLGSATTIGWSATADPSAAADTQIKRDSAGVLGFYGSGSTYGSLHTGALLTSVVSKTTAYTATVADSTILCDTTAAGFTVTLPAAATCSGLILYVKKISSDANELVVDGNAAETIDGTTTRSIITQYETLTIQSNGTAWYVL